MICLDCVLGNYVNEECEVDFHYISDWSKPCVCNSERIQRLLEQIYEDKLNDN